MNSFFNIGRYSAIRRLWYKFAGEYCRLEFTYNENLYLLFSIILIHADTFWMQLRLKYPIKGVLSIIRNVMQQSTMTTLQV